MADRPDRWIERQWFHRKAPHRFLTLAPLALGISRGAGLQKPLATAIIFRLLAAVPLVQLLMPACVHQLELIEGRSKHTRKPKEMTQ